MSAHRLGEERSIAMHAVIAERLDREVVAQARQRLSKWTMSQPYKEAWEAWLDLPLEELRERLVGRGEQARAMRQCTPFTGVLSPQERWEIRRSVR